MDNIASFSQFHHSRHRRPHNPPQPVPLVCRNAADLVAAAPYMMGFTVTNSLVLLLLDSQRGSIGALRFQLPSHELSPQQRREHANTLADTVQSLRQVDRVALLLYPGGTRVRAAELPHAQLVLECAKAVEDTGRRVLEALCVTDTHWADYFTPGANPDEGFPMSEVRQRPIALECAANTPVPIRPLDEVTLVPRVDPQRIAAVHARCTRMSAKPREQTTIGHDPWRAWDFIERVHSTMTQAFDEIPPPRVAQLIGGLQREENWVNVAALSVLGWEHWDSVFATTVREHRMTLRERECRKPHSTQLYSGAQRYAALLALLRKLGVNSPDPHSREHLSELLRYLAAVAPPRLRLHIDALRAYGWWAAGLPTLAQQVVADALRAHRATASSDRARTPSGAGRVPGDAGTRLTNRFDTVARLIHTTPQPLWAQARVA